MTLATLKNKAEAALRIAAYDGDEDEMTQPFVALADAIKLADPSDPALIDLLEEAWDICSAY